MTLKIALLTVICTCLVISGMMLSLALFKQSDFDKKYYYHEEKFKRTTMCV